jgi:catechol 2,3-dioxygenase-like lactoylglutathione lyase family enzyme
MTSTREVIVRAESLAAAKSFYHGVMGFEMVVDSPLLAGFDTGAFTLYVEPGADPTPVFEFETADVNETRDRLLASGCTLVEEDPSVPRCYLRDPLGVVFNLSTSSGAPSGG